MPKSAPKSEDREARLAAALRANLKRRKAQSRQKGRAQAVDGAAMAPPKGPTA